MTSPGDASRPRFPQAVWGWVLALMGIAVLGVMWGIPNEQNDLTARAADAIADSGLDVRFDGRDATILGSADQATLDAAEDAIRNLRGVRRVDISAATVAAEESQAPTTTTAPATLTTAPPTPTAPADLAKPAFTALYSDGALELFGILPSPNLILDIENTAQEVLGVTNVTSNLEVGEVTSPYYLDDLKSLFSVANGLDPWNFSIDAATAEFGGMGVSAESVAERRAAFGVFAAANALGEVDVALETNPAAVAASLTELLAEGANFETGSARLSEDATSRLATVIEIMLSNPSTAVTVAGHTDDQGAAAENQVLSEERAQAVVDYLLAGGVAAERLTAVGYGEDQPITDNDTAAGRAINRRIEFVVSEGEIP